MKKLLFTACLLLPALALYAAGIQEDYKNADEKARLSYAFGMLIGSNLSTAEIDFDYDAFTNGVRDKIENAKTQFSEQEAIEIVETALQAASDKNSEVNRMQEVEFLTKNAERPEVQITPSGLQYEVLAGTEGEKPAANSVVKVHYEGTFIDGSLFDASDEEDGAFIPLDRVIPGWTEGLMLMSVGSKFKLYIPSELAYGKDGIQSIIPAYSTLVFTVELLEIIGDDDDDSDEDDF